MKLLFLFVAVAFVCLPANSHLIKNEITPFQNQISFDAVEKGFTEELGNEAKDLLDKLVQTIISNLSKPKKDITDLKKVIENIYNESVEILMKTYIEQEKKLLKDVIDVVDCYKKEAEKYGISLEECADKTEGQLLAIPEDFFENLTQCAVDEYDGAMEIFNKAMKIYDSVVKDVSDYSKKIGDCTKLSWLSSPKCFLNLIKDIGSLTVKIPTTYVPRVTALASRLTTYIGGMKLRIVACGSLKTANLGIQCTEITADFINCAEQKFPNPVQCIN